MSTDTSDRLPFHRTILTDHGYTLMDRIGIGSYSTVYTVHSKKYQNVTFAAKIMTLESPVSNSSIFETEIEILTRLSHSHIVSLFDAFHSGNDCFLILEHCVNGPIDSYIRAQHLSEPHVISMFRPIISAIAYCHSERIAVRDIKPGNILIDHYGRPKLADFGLSCIVKPTEGSHYAGSLAYMAPELFTNLVDVDLFSADIWSLGITFYRLLIGSLPWPKLLTSAQLMGCVLAGGPEIPESLSPPLRGLIQRMTARDPNSRPRAGDLLKEGMFQEQRKPINVGREVVAGRRMSDQYGARASHSASVAPHGVARPRPMIPLVKAVPRALAGSPAPVVRARRLSQLSSDHEDGKN
jgi:serine/threonine protein kinase